MLQEGSDPHVGQGLPDVAQGAGKGRVFEFEAFDCEVDVVGDTGILGLGFELKLKFDLLHQLSLIHI